MPRLYKRRLLLVLSCALVGLASVAWTRARSPGSGPRSLGFSGLYVRISDGWIAYYQLAEQGNALYGFYTVVQVDLRDPTGARAERTEINGTADGSTASLRTGASPGIFSAPIGAASLSRGTLTVSAPSSDGRMMNATYQRTSQDELNREIVSLRARTRAYRQQNDEAARVHALRTDLLHVISDLTPSIVTRRGELIAQVQTGQQEVSRAAAKLDSARAMAKAARVAANQAYRRAITPEEQVRAGHLDADAGYAESNVGVAEAQLSFAQAQLQTTSDELRECEQQLQAMRARAARDSTALKLR